MYRDKLLSNRYSFESFLRESCFVSFTAYLMIRYIEIIDKKLLHRGLNAQEAVLVHRSFDLVLNDA